MRVTKSRLNALECSLNQVVDALAHHGERSETTDDRMRQVEVLISDTLREFHRSVELLLGIVALVKNMEDRIKELKDAFKFYAMMVTDLQDTVTLMK